MERKCYKKMTTMLVVLLVTIIKVQDVIAALECNGTSSNIGDCIGDVDEFLMESETSTMILAGKHLSINAPGDTAKICEESIYGNCIDNPNVVATRCNYGTRCNREIS
ncbi:hypothetical protein KY290_015464 [Solanum tuberosum]|uniref:Uncharacterized protein n=2 Tax=Solanum tuberosum TaxID=4113 RepID=A0ABQ7VSS3_SOLTU|nr:hypothetical protein KY289_025333 [Solanum tuberosum]KAH0674215.1 hypothetical protein KY284_025302 [Solanum tuberosum]KAH0718808.1 hypothetical protein KY285_014839 [Solanum tuberosum]KAH0756060.1 hypothetical protein KY290_026330 [Solanum tuberosum]KAH0771483.1 hypothetical protein KY290_015464 [Solanum tuberosum]